MLLSAAAGLEVFLRQVQKGEQRDLVGCRPFAPEVGFIKLAFGKFQNLFDDPRIRFGRLEDKLLAQEAGLYGVRSGRGGWEASVRHPSVVTRIRGFGERFVGQCRPFVVARDAMTPTSSTKKTLAQDLLNPAVLVAALGYFVDIFDLILFSVVRKPSLASLGLSAADQITQGIFLHNLQMAGMLFGGIFWGILADRRGRLSVLFGSILLYSVANLANAAVHTVEGYAIWRFVAGFGLAGELGAGITLVAETLSKERRGYGTMVVATVGVSGAVVAGLIAEVFDWRVTYAIGGVLGLALLLLRINTAESHLFTATEKRAKVSGEKRGQFLSLFTSSDRFSRFARCILLGVPIWFVIGTMIQLSPEFSQALGIEGGVTAGRAVIFCYGGLVLGDFTSGLLSQAVGSRVRVVLGFLIGLGAVGTTYFVLPSGTGAWTFYAICGLLGLFSGYWAIFATLAAEQFGTNLRATVATSAPNFVRGSVVPMSLTFAALKPSLGLVPAAQLVGAVVLTVAILAAAGLRDTFGKDLNFEE